MEITVTLEVVSNASQSDTEDAVRQALCGMEFSASLDEATEVEFTVIGVSNEGGSCRTVQYLADAELQSLWNRDAEQAGAA